MWHTGDCEWVQWGTSGQGDERWAQTVWLALAHTAEDGGGLQAHCGLVPADDSDPGPHLPPGERDQTRDGARADHDICSDKQRSDESHSSRCLNFEIMSVNCVMSIVHNPLPDGKYFLPLLTGSCQLVRPRVSLAQPIYNKCQKKFQIDTITSIPIM